MFIVGTALEVSCLGNMLTIIADGSYLSYPFNCINITEDAAED